MLANEPTWTAERVELLKLRFEAGLSCREIADDIGVSRNAVIGKLSRLNLTRGRGGDGPRPPRKDTAKGHRPRTMPRVQYQLLQTVYAEPEPAVGEEPIQSGPGCSLLELSAEKCRFLFLRQHAGRRSALLRRSYKARLPAGLSPARRAGMRLASLSLSGARHQAWRSMVRRSSLGGSPRKRR
jgi:GcrA cell cycle regulator